MYAGCYWPHFIQSIHMASAYVVNRLTLVDQIGKHSLF
jgi:hypothetical protein